MINFRYHVVSLIAVFLALGIGIIMGTAVIDRAVVDRLEKQQDSLQADVDEVQTENNRLRGELRGEREQAQQLAEEGGQRLLDGELDGVPVLVVAARGSVDDGLAELVEQLGRSGAEYAGTLWLTDRFTLDDEGERSDLAAVLDFGSDATAGSLRSGAIAALSRSLRPPVPTLEALADPSVVPMLLDAGFLDYEAPDDAAGDAFPDLDPAIRILAVSGLGTEVPDHLLMLPLLRSLVVPRGTHEPAEVLAAVMAPAEGAEDTFVAPIRDDEELAEEVATVDDLGDFAGRVAAVLALSDLGEGRIGHYGRGPGAQRLLPAPAG